MNENIANLDLPLMLKIEEVADLLSISKSRAYDMVKLGMISYLRIGKCIRIPRESFLEFISATCTREPPWPASILPQAPSWAASVLPQTAPWPASVLPQAPSSSDSVQNDPEGLLVNHCP